MSRFSKAAIALGVVGLILLIFNFWWLGLLAIAAAVAIPVASYFMLDPAQRRRLKEIRRRKQIGN